jgi:hypothetical protein
MEQHLQEAKKLDPNYQSSFHPFRTLF